MPTSPRWLPLLVVLCVACGGGTTTPEVREPAPAPVTPTEAAAPEPSGTGMSRPPNPVERAIINDLTRVASEVRHLPFQRPVPALVEDETRIRAFVESQIEDEELLEAREVYVALGLLPRDLDLRALMLDLLGEQIVGYYDPDDGHLVVRDDVMRSLMRIGGERRTVGEAGIVLVHELVHALQDQNLDLARRHGRELDSDASNAFRAVVEGDATLAMVAHVLAAQGIPIERITSQRAMLDRFFGSGASMRGGGSQLGTAPAILRVTLTAAYTRGALFCADAHRRNGWGGVDDAHRDEPESMEQVLHPEAYARREHPDTVTVSGLEGMVAAGYSELDQDTLGELELGVYFAQGTSRDTDDRAAAGWNGDRLVVMRHDTASTAVVWWTTWDSESQAAEAMTAARRAGASAERSHVVREGRAVLILRDVPAAETPALEAAFRAFATTLPSTPQSG